MSGGASCGFGEICLMENYGWSSLYQFMPLKRGLLDAGNLGLGL